MLRADCRGSARSEVTSRPALLLRGNANGHAIRRTAAEFGWFGGILTVSVRSHAGQTVNASSPEHQFCHRIVTYMQAHRTEKTRTFPAFCASLPVVADDASPIAAFSDGADYAGGSREVGDDPPERASERARI